MRSLFDGQNSSSFRKKKKKKNRLFQKQHMLIPVHGTYFNRGSALLIRARFVLQKPILSLSVSLKNSPYHDLTILYLSSRTAVSFWTEILATAALTCMSNFVALFL